MEIAKLLSVNPETVRRWIREKRIDCLKGRGRQGYSITDAHLQDFLEKNPSMVTGKALAEIESLSLFEKSDTAESDDVDTIIEKMDLLDKNMKRSFEEYQKLSKKLHDLKSRDQWGKSRKRRGGL
jgi:excisionase family DNA binding protein